jgi:CRP-like cAMP-binding protein
MFKVCCGESEEPTKNGLLVVTINGGGGRLQQLWNRLSPTEQKASVALKVKARAGRRKSIFSSPLEAEDVTCFECKLHDKDPKDLEFLKETMKNHILFEELTKKELLTLVGATERVEVEPGDRLQAQDGLGEYMFIVQKGELSLFSENSKRTLGRIRAGCMYGETDLLYGVPAANALVAEMKSVVWKLGQMNYRKVVAKHALESDSDIKIALRKVKLFNDLPEPTIKKFAYSLTRVNYRQGDVIIKKGDVGNIFYMIEQGKVKVHDIGIGDSKQVDSYLGPGDSFGERALMTGARRAANVTAATEEVVCLVMDRATFQESIGELEDLLDQSNRLQSLKGLSIFAESDLTQIELEQLAEMMTKESYNQGTKLVKAGSPYPPKLWMFLSGKVIVYGTKSDHIYNMRAGDYFGDKSIMNAHEHISSHDATCETDVTAYALTREAIESVIVNFDRLGNTSGFQMNKLVNTVCKQDLRVCKILGQGAFGKVWLCSASVEGKEAMYALKVIHKRELLKQKMHRGVLREKELLAMLHHPFILNLVSSFSDETNLYLLLPLIQGGELFEVMEERSGLGKGLSKFDSAFYGAGILEALGHFHHRYIAYRDLKLENVMIDILGYAKIVDLGFAKIILDKSYTFCGSKWLQICSIVHSVGVIPFTNRFPLFYSQLPTTSLQRSSWPRDTHMPWIIGPMES